jgi:homoserine dehydrogenase
MKDIYTEGISNITPMDIEYAKQLLSICWPPKSDDGPIEARVHPTLRRPGTSFHGCGLQRHFVRDAVGSTFYGAGAGMMATGSAVVSDLVNLRSAWGRLRVPLLAYQREHLHRCQNIHPRHHRPITWFTVVDRRGPFPDLRHSGNMDISLASVIQKGRRV